MKHFTEVELDAIMSHKLTQYVHDEDIRALAAYAKELRQVLKTVLDCPAIKRQDYEDGSPWIKIQVNEPWISEAHRLLVEDA